MISFGRYRTRERPAAEATRQHLRLPGLHPLLRQEPAGEVHRRTPDQPEEVPQEVPGAERLAQGGAEPHAGEGVVAGAEGQTDGPLPVLRGQRQHADRCAASTGSRYALAMKWLNRRSQKQSFTWDRLCGLPEALPSAAAADCPQPVHPVACEVSFTEEPDVGNLQVRFCEGH